MAKKTVINRAMKQIINTHGDAFVQEADERTADIDRNELLEANVEYEIIENANTVPFEPAQIEEKPLPPQMPKPAEKEPAPANNGGQPWPDFMKPE